MATKTFHQVNEHVVEEIKNELRLQGHYLTGALEASLLAREVDEQGNIVLTAQALAYLEELEKGVPGNEISTDSKSVSDMTRYVTLRMGYKGKQATKVALAILRKQQKEGMPTKNSYNYSKTGERMFAVEDTFYKNRQEFESLLDDAAIGQLDDQFHQTKSGTI